MTDHDGHHITVERLDNCARCGHTHLNLTYEALQNPVVDGDGTTWRYWVACPTNGQPVLMRVRPVA